MSTPESFLQATSSSDANPPGHPTTAGPLLSKSAAVVDIQFSPWKVVALALCCILMTGTGALLAFFGEGAEEVVIGWIALVFFGGCTVLFAKQLMLLGGPVVTLTASGIVDRRAFRTEIPWTDVTDVSLTKMGGPGTTFVVLHLTPAGWARLNAGGMARRSRSANRSLGIDGLPLATSGLKIESEELLRLASDRQNAAHRGTA